MSKDTIDRAFPQHPLAKPADETVAAASVVRDAYRNLAKLIDDLLPGSREKALAMTTLEESSTWAVKAVYVDKVQITPGDPAGAAS